jgi:hypothetical protein
MYRNITSETRECEVASSHAGTVLTPTVLQAERTSIQAEALVLAFKQA